MEAPLPSHFQHQQIHDPNSLFQPPPHHHTLVSQLDLDPSDPFQFNAQFDAPSPLSHLQSRNVLDPQLGHEPRYSDIQPHISQLPQHVPSRPRAKNPAPAQGGQFGVLTPQPIGDSPTPSTSWSIWTTAKRFWSQAGYGSSGRISRRSFQ